MPHVSKRGLNKQQFQKLYRQLINSINDVDDFLWQFLTPTEKIMFSKRLAILLLLDQGESTYGVWQKLDVSPSTVERIAKKWNKGGYSKVIAQLKNDKNAIEDFANWLNTAGGLLPKYIKGRK